MMLIIILFTALYASQVKASNETFIGEARLAQIGAVIITGGCSKRWMGCDGSCMYVGKMCNGVKECKEGFDEDYHLCSGCPDHYFKCDNHVCKSVLLLCDGKRDCLDGKDENDRMCRRNCAPPHFFHCLSGECVPTSSLCNGYYECADHSDETTYCSGKIYSLLTGGRDERSGIVHVNLFGFWGTICGDEFGDNEARVVCRSMGFRGPATAHRRGIMGKGKGHIWFENIRCNGSEENLIECQKDPWGEHFCTHDTDVAVTCSYPKEIIKISQIEVCGFSFDDLKNYSFAGQQTFIPMKDLPTPTCIRPTSSSEERIILGDIVIEESMLPYIADIRVATAGSSYHVCGGAILTEYFVITAAQCVKNKPVIDLLVRVGSLDQKMRSPIDDNYEVEKIIVHPDYNISNGYKHDIALLKIKPKADHGILFHWLARPVCLPNTTEKINVESHEATIAGWGLTEIGQTSRFLKKEKVDIFPSDICRRYYPFEFYQGMGCALQTDNLIASSCFGDTGGPVIIKMNDRATILGIISWRQGCAQRRKHLRYVEIKEYLPWILEQMKKACD